MSWLMWLLTGVVLGWLIEFAIDYLFWQRRSEEKSSELSRIQGRIGDLESRALAAERETKQVASRLAEVQSALDQAHHDLTGSHTIQETLRKNIQILEDRVDNWGRKIGLLSSAHGPIGSLGAAFSQDEDELLKAQIEALNARLTPAPQSPTQLTHDPLHLINGIGAVYEQRLNDAGIYTFADLIGAGSQRIHQIINPKDWQSINSEDWIAQAQQLLVRGGGK